MEQETQIAESIRVMDTNAQYDAACKRLLSEKIILAWIMHSCLDEFREVEVNEIAAKYIEGEPQVGEVPVAPDETNASRIHGMGTEDTSLTEGTVTYDIRFLAIAPVSGERIRLIVNVEAQQVYKPGYPLTKRGIYYCSRMISSQYGTEFTKSQYQNIKKVYSIWIAMKPPKEKENTITRYRIIEENLVGNVRETVQNYDLMTLLVLCPGSPEQGHSKILQLLSILLSSEKEAAEKKQILERNFSIPMTETLERRLDTMCNLSEGVMERGRAEGRVEGRIEERENNILQMAKILSLKDIAACLQLPLEYVQSVVNKSKT